MSKKHERIGCIVCMKENIEKLQALCEFAIRRCEMFSCATNDPDYPHRTVGLSTEDSFKMEAALMEYRDALNTYVRIVNEEENRDRRQDREEIQTLMEGK